MNDFTYEEMFLVEAYNGGTRTGTIDALNAMRGHLEADETELRELTDATIQKLSGLSDQEYSSIPLYDHEWNPFQEP